MRRMWTRALLVGAIGLAAGSTVGCAEERAPINRVQANALAKSFFVGMDLKDIVDDPEFYMRGTVVDVGYGAAQDGLFTSTYAQPISRIRWEITEDFLNARLSYERIADSDGKGNQFDALKKKTTNDGQIVASYRITQHFDIRRSYNPTTGEEQNVVEENASDRPWYEREYFRVDWSSNLSTDAYDFDTLSMMGLYGGIQYSPLSYAVTDPASEDAPHFSPDEGYFDVTNKAFATPSLIDLSSLGWGIDTFPACYLPGEFAGGTNPYGNCNPVEITLRQAFRKVVDNDYEPKDWDGFKFQAFGIFTTERTGYERNYGMTDNRWFRFADRYNMWTRSHYYRDPEKMTGAEPCATKEKTEIPTGNPASDPNRDDNLDGTADECEAVTAATGKGGSQCDVFNHKCTLPYVEREAKVIPWYINGRTADQFRNPDGSASEATLKAEQEKAEDLFEATNWAVVEWDLAMKTAVQTSRYVECKRTGGDPAACKAQYPMWTGQQEDNELAAAASKELDICRRNGDWDATSCAGSTVDPSFSPEADAINKVVAMPPVIVLCHNPVIAGDHPACGAEGLSPRLGDIRYNQVLNIDKPQAPSAWGIMVDCDDPVTGEKVAASINVWTHITDIASQGLTDLVRYINGELAPADVTEGTYVLDWAQASKLGSGGIGPTISRDQINARIAASTGLSAKQFDDLTKNGLGPAIEKSVRKFHNEEVLDIVQSRDVPSTAAIEAQARMNQLRGTPAEAKLMNQPMLQLAGIQGNFSVTGAMADLASPMALNNPKVMSELRKMRENALAARGACILNEAPESSAIPTIAEAMKRKFGAPSADDTPSVRMDRARKMQRYLMRRYHYAVIAHEMGHSIGLRHNFVSSSASLFYRPQYWQLRTKDGTVENECLDAVDLSKDPQGHEKCIGPRYFDPLTDAEQSQAIWMFMQSTVMDYPGDVSHDLIGLGAYDYAAARFFYGDVTSVYNVTEPIKVGTKTHQPGDYAAGGLIGTGITLATDTFGGLVGISYGLKNAPSDFHYAQLQKNYGVIHDCKEIHPVQPASWNADKDGNWDALIDGGFVAPDGINVPNPKYTSCRSLPVDYLDWNQLRYPKAAELAGGYYRGGNSIEANPPTGQKARVRVGYAFATDHWADTGNVSVFRHDNGADPYEQMQFLITTQENRHIFDNYRRGRNTFNVRAAADRSFSRYNEKLLGISGGIGFLSNIYKNFATSQGFSYDTLWPFIISAYYKQNMVAATIGFDHFTRELGRPQSGEHYFFPAKFGDPSLRAGGPDNDSDGNAGATVLVVPNGTTGYLKDVGIGGHPLENRLGDNGDYGSQLTINAGSYYDKINTAILMSESEDRFISQSRQDFYDARFRAVGMADVVPEGYRRIMANALTGDRTLLGPRVTATNGKPNTIGTSDPNDPKNAVLSKLYPKDPLGWTSWWPSDGPSVCFPSNGSNVCTGFTGTEGDFNPLTPGGTAVIDPQIGWETQKFLIAWTLAYIPANEQSNWLDMMRIYKIGQNADPSIENRIEWQDPVSGTLYYARTYGQECLFGTPGSNDEASCVAGNGRWVQKGIAARVLEYANSLTSKSYVADPAYAATNGFNDKGGFMVKHNPDGTAMIAHDPAMQTIDANGNAAPGKPFCDLTLPEGDPGHPVGCVPLTKWDNHFAVQLDNYKAVPDYLWEVVIRYGLGEPGELGLYP